MEATDRTGSALVFPGMGPVPFAEVAKFMLVNPFARTLFAEADEVLGYSLFERFKQAEETTRSTPRWRSS